jgi:hypothetical protein
MCRGSLSLRPGQQPGQEGLGEAVAGQLRQGLAAELSPTITHHLSLKVIGNLDIPAAARPLRAGLWLLATEYPC